MVKRISIFSARNHSHQIGFIEGGRAFDLSGRRRCSYNENTGNLTDADSGNVVGHVSLEGIFVGSSWMADELFPEPDDGSTPIAPTNLTAEPSASVGQEIDVDRALNMIRLVLGNK